MTECFSPYNPRERSVPCPYCMVDTDEQCLGVWSGYSHPDRMEAGLAARKAAAS